MSTSSFSEAQVIEALRTVQEPELHRDLVSLNMISDLKIDGDTVSLKVILTTPACPLKAKIHADVQRAVLGVPGVKHVHVDLSSTVQGARTSRQPVAGIKNIVAIASGKGGVGKSTVSALLALALAREGARVGLFDADIYGPSIPRMMGMVGHKPQGNDHGKIEPVVREGIKMMSMGFLVEPSQAIIWRGPMVHKAIQQFMYDVEWGQLDYLLVDLPPGTGDAQLTLSQSIPLAGVVAVTTPQEVAFTIAAKVITMFREMKVPALGVIENMSYFQCGHCNEETPIFGKGGGREIARQMDVPLIGSLPLDPLLCRDADLGEMGQLLDSASPLAQKILSLARDVAARVSVMNHTGVGAAEVVTA